jgi:RNA polymerase sigma-70 factor (ECF subfamily)
MKKSQLSDHELILNYLAGNDLYFEILLKRYKSKVFATIYSIVHDRYVAEELFQETFIKVCQQIREHKYTDDGRFSRWLIRIARNICIDHLRKVKNKLTITDSEGNDIFSYLVVKQDSIEDQIIRKEYTLSIREMIRQLPDNQREVLIMRHYGDLSFKEIAQNTNVSINTALGRMRYALMNLRKMILAKQLSLQ